MSVNAKSSFFKVAKVSTLRQVFAFKLYLKVSVDYNEQ